MKEKICIGCGNTTHLYKMKSGAYVCKDCLNEIGQEIKIIKGTILNYLKEEYDINKPEHIVLILNAIAETIKLDNNLLTDREKKKIVKAAERMSKAIE